MDIINNIGLFMLHIIPDPIIHIVDNINRSMISINDFIWGWPLLIFVMCATVVTTIALKGIQFTQFFQAWKLTVFPEKEICVGDMTPFQAFMNALSTSIGNGSIAGIATAVQLGGPGAALWIFIFGLFSMILRFAEVYLSIEFAPLKQVHGTIGGPMIYLQKLPAGKILAYIYAISLLFLGLASGNAMQANSICLGFVRVLSISPIVVAFILLAFVAYVMLGGAERIVKVSDMIVPVKVGLFFSTALIVLGYHYQSLWDAFGLIITGAFYPQAIMAGAAGYMIQQAMRYGIVRSVNATEAGIGTAAVLFGGTACKEPYKNGLMSMISVFISANLVCFMVALMIIASGVWNNGQTSLNLTISAYETVFGVLGGWIVTLLSVSFGMGVLVTYGYIARSCWLFLTSGRFERFFDILFCAATFVGALAKVDVVWNAADIGNTGLLITNLLGILYFLPYIRKKI